MTARISRAQRIWALTIAAALLLGTLYANAAGWYEIDAGYNLIEGIPAKYGIELAGSGRAFGPLIGEAREAYGLPGPDKHGRDRILTAAVLGAPVGVVGESGEARFVGCTVYALAGHEDDESVCVVASPDFGYLPFYCEQSYELPPVEVALWQSPQAVFETYGLPDPAGTCTVTGGEAPLALDAAAAQTLCSLLGGLQNEGHALFVGAARQLERQVYGSLSSYGAREVSDRAAALRGEAARTVILTDADGYRLYLTYYPAIRCIELFDAYYFVREAEAATLQGLLYRADERAELPETVLRPEDWS